VTGPVLRPLGVGDIVDRVIALYRADWRLFLVVSAVPNLVVIFLTNAFTLAFPNAFLVGDELLGAGADPAALQRAADRVRGVELGPLLLFAILSVVPTLVAVGGLIAAAAARALGRPITAAAALRAGLRATPRLVLAGLGGTVLFGLAWALLGGLAFALTGLAGIFAVLFVVVAFGLPLYVLASWATVPVVVTLEPIGALAALGRAWRLAGGFRWRILGLFLLLAVIQVALSALFGLLLIGPLIASPAAGRVASAIVSGLVTIAWEPLPWATLTLLYLDLRVRKEGLDLQLAAEALAREA